MNKKTEDKKDSKNIKAEAAKTEKVSTFKKKKISKTKYNFWYCLCLFDI